MIEMKVKGLAVDANSKIPVVILTDPEEKRYLPIWIGIYEADAILIALEKINVPRPMTHDLLKSTLETLGVKIERILIHNIQNNTFYARISLRRKEPEEKWEIDARPSDAIALGLRAECPILVSEKVIVEASITDKSKYEKEKIEFKKFFKDLKPADFNR
ncbi:bifunctional nuclease family protein [bacterium]|nr:bifunctional nuclease family protein [bacterium]